MIIVNQWPDPHCANKVSTWGAKLGNVTITRDGSHWKYVMSKGSALIPMRKADCMMLEFNPPGSLDFFHPERATMLLREDGTLAMDTTPESGRNVVGIVVSADAETTVLGLCAVDLDEWPILREAGALVFAADTAPY